VTTELQKKARASPRIVAETVPFAHTQDFIAALAKGLQPENIQNSILRAIAFAVTRQSKSADGQYLARKGKEPWFKFSAIAPDGKNVAPSLHSFPRTSKIPGWAKAVKCRECGEENKTFFFEITVLHPCLTDGRPQKIKIGFITIECGKLVLDNLDLKDFGL